MRRTSNDLEGARGTSSQHADDHVVHQARQGRPSKPEIIYTRTGIDRHGLPRDTHR